MSNPDVPLLEGPLTVPPAEPAQPPTEGLSPDDTRLSVAANAIGWALRHHERARDDGTITVTAGEAAEDLEIARRVVEHLDVWDAMHEPAPAGLTPEQTIRHHALTHAVAWLDIAADIDRATDGEGNLWDTADHAAAYIRDGSRP